MHRAESPFRVGGGDAPLRNARRHRSASTPSRSPGRKTGRCPAGPRPAHPRLSCACSGSRTFFHHPVRTPSRRGARRGRHRRGRSARGSAGTTPGILKGCHRTSAHRCRYALPGQGGAVGLWRERYGRPRLRPTVQSSSSTSTNRGCSVAWTPSVGADGGLPLSYYTRDPRALTGDRGTLPPRGCAPSGGGQRRQPCMRFTSTTWSTTAPKRQPAVPISTRPAAAGRLVRIAGTLQHRPGSAGAWGRGAGTHPRMSGTTPRTPQVRAW